MSLEDHILKRLRLILPDKEAVYDLHEPNFLGNELHYVTDCIHSGWVSSAGTYVTQFESRLSEWTRIDNVVATVNGTAALHTCCLVSDIRPGDEVLLPTLTFVATANAVAYCQATPHFVDSEKNTFGVDAKALNDYLSHITMIRDRTCFNKYTGRRISALIVTHVFGQPVDLDNLLEVCKRFRLLLIEDAAEALGSFYKNYHVGSTSHIAALSFNGNKLITTGGGGAILTQHAELAKKARHLTTTARCQDRGHFIHDQVGYNYRMPNINAALGCGQLERIDEYLRSKRALAVRYQTLFSDMPHDVVVLKEASHTRSNYWLNVLRIKARNSVAVRDSLLSFLLAAGIKSRPIWQLMHRLSMYKKCPCMPVSIAESLWDSVLLLPSSPDLLNSINISKDMVLASNPL